jgi:hypothetical protein
MKREPSKSAFKYTFLIILSTTILSEAIVMHILHHTKTPYNNLVLLDSMLLVILLIPMLYFFVYRPQMFEKWFEWNRYS